MSFIASRLNFKGYKLFLKRRFFVLFLFMSCGVMSQAWAGVPVVDLSTPGLSSSEEAADREAGDQTQEDLEAPRSFTRASNKPTVDSPSGTQLQQQFANYLHLNLPEKIENLQQEITELRGQLELQAHTLSLLQDTKSDAVKPKSEIKEDAKSIIDKPIVDKKEGVETEQQAYNHAFNLIKEKKYTQAIEGLNHFLILYPVKEEGSSTYGLNAYYWLGELYFLQEQFEQAATQFNIIIKKFPQNAKAADALLKLGLSYTNLGKKAQAKQSFQDLKHRFPDSAAAQTATIELQKL